MNIALFLVAILPFYLLGVFPSGIILARMRGVDITKVGSGNVGATNVARTLGKRAGVVTLLMDLGKGLLAVLVASWVSPFGWYLTGASVAVVCGHCFSIPPWLKGGKGVATALGVMLGLAPSVAVAAIVVFIGLFAPFRVVSLASIAAAITAPLYSLVSNQPDHISAALVVMSGVVIYRHRENITRIIEGREPKFSSSKG